MQIGKWNFTFLESFKLKYSLVTYFAVFHDYNFVVPWLQKWSYSCISILSWRIHASSQTSLTSSLSGKEETINFSVLNMYDFSRHILVPREFIVETCFKSGASAAPYWKHANILSTFNFKQALYYVKKGIWKRGT